MVKVHFDPARIVIGCFERMFPDKPCQVNFAADIGNKAGITYFTDDGEPPVVAISHKIQGGSIAAVLSHELAHVAFGKDHRPELFVAAREIFSAYLAAVERDFEGETSWRADA